MCPVGTCAKRKATRRWGVKRAGGTAVPLAKIERPGVFRSFLFRQKGTEKPERHARFGKSPQSPHFRCGRARSRDVGCHWDGSRPACASPPRKRASGFACTPLRRQSALTGSWLRGRICPAWIWERAGEKWEVWIVRQAIIRFCYCNRLFLRVKRHSRNAQYFVPMPLRTLLAT